MVFGRLIVNITFKPFLGDNGLIAPLFKPFIRLFNGDINCLYIDNKSGQKVAITGLYSHFFAFFRMI